jgi:hypothetical protein
MRCAHSKSVVAEIPRQRTLRLGERAATNKPESPVGAGRARSFRRGHFLWLSYLSLPYSSHQLHRGRQVFLRVDLRRRCQTEFDKQAAFSFSSSSFPGIAIRGLG